MLQQVSASGPSRRWFRLHWDTRLFTSTLLMLTLGLLTGCAGSDQPIRDKPIRVVLITLDTLRYDSPTDQAKMPRLHHWSETSTVFERFFSASASTQPSHASMFTGLHPWEHGVTGNGMSLDDRHRTIAERLQEANFTTAAVVSSLPVSRHLGFAQGFDHFDDDFQLGRVTAGEWFVALSERGSSEQGSSGDGEAGESQASEDQRFYSLGDHVTERAEELLDSASADRQFFWFHFFDPHAPYGDTVGSEQILPSEVLGIAARGEDPAAALERARRLYDVDVAFLDDVVGRLLDRLEADRETIDTHVVITADHGESFGEGGSMGHGRRLIPSQIHVPLIVRSSRMQPGVRQDVCGSIDIAATLLDIAGIDTAVGPQAKPAKSRNLIRPTERPAWAFGMRRTYRELFKDYRLDGSVVDIDGYLFFSVNPQGELYRGHRDAVVPHTAAPLPDDEARRLRGIFGSFEDSQPRPSEREAIEPEIEEGLRALGYVG